jgi:hypothetical protein
MPPPAGSDDDKVFAPVDGITSLDEIRLQRLRLLEAAMEDRIELQFTKAEHAQVVPPLFRALDV